MPTIGEALDAAARKLAETSNTPRLDARILLAHAAGLSPEVLLGERGRFLESVQEATFTAVMDRRIAGEPVSRIVGHREFWSLEFVVTRDVLDPRPDSETLVDALLTAVPDRSARLRILDLGTGTGCLLLAALSEYPNAWGVGIDRSPPAAAIAHANAARLGFGSRASFAVANWGDALGAQFDAILCNPPYIPTSDMARLPREVVRHDPHLALHGGQDGLNEYRSLAPVLARALSPSGCAVVELGAGQSDDVSAIADANGLAVGTLHRDLSGIERGLVLRLKHAF